MKITLDIKDSYSSLFLNFLKTLSYVKVEEKFIDIPEQHKALIRSRIKNSKKENLLDWDKVKDDFKFD